MCLLYISILYADIVGFTQLSSTCTPEELVGILNKLFGRFDDIAKVKHTSHYCYNLFLRYFLTSLFLVCSVCRRTAVCVLRFWVTVITACQVFQTPYLITLVTVFRWVWTCALL